MLLGVCFIYCLFTWGFLNISDAYHNHDSGPDIHAYVQSSVFYRTFGTAELELKSPGQETLITDVVFVLLLGGESDFGARWTDRLVCEGMNLTVDSYDMLFGGTVTFDVDFQAETCDVTLHNDVSEETFEFNETLTSGCVSVHNVSEPGVYFLDASCVLADIPTMTPSPNSTASWIAGSNVTFNKSGCLERESCLDSFELFDKSFKNQSTALISYASKRLSLQPNSNAIETCNGIETYKWRVFQINGSDVTPVNLSQSDSWSLTIPAMTLTPGLYVIVLELEFEISSTDVTYDEDYMYLRVVLPELVATIKGATMRESNGSEAIVYDASGSRDPVTGSIVTNDVLTTMWSVLSVSGLSYIDTVNCIASFPYCSVLETGSVAWQNISDYYSSQYLYLDTSEFPNNTTVFVIFTISRGSRVSSAIQSLYISSNARPMSLSCLYNCPASTYGKMAYDKLELDLLVEGVNAKYKWSAMRLENNSFIVDSGLAAKLAASNRTMYVSKSDISEGATYMFSVLMTVVIDGTKYETRAGYMRTVNYRPYGGTCSINKLSGFATVERFKVFCKNWKDEGERTSRNPTVDTGSSLIYALVQSTRDAYIEEETLLVTDKRRMYVYIKPGDRFDDDNTNLTVRIIDIFGDAATVTFNMRSIPILDVTSISADDTGAQLVRDYMTQVIQLTSNQKSYQQNIILPIISSAAEQLLQIPLPRKPSQIAKTVDGVEGVLLDIDLTDANSSNSITFREYYQTSISSELDPATNEIQDAFLYLSGKAYDVLYHTVVQGHRSDDQHYLNQLTQCFTNLIAVREYANTITKSYVVLGLQILSSASGTVWVEMDGLSAEEEQSENSLVDMTSDTVNSVVPNDLHEVRIVDNLDVARHQIDDMTKIAGNNMTKAISEAHISPSERAYLYLKVQEKLRYDLDKVKGLARSSAASIVNVSRSILDTTDVCLSCIKTVGSGLNRQKLVSMTSSNLGSTTLALNTASIRLNSLKNGGEHVQKVLMMQMEKNIFMYDSDGTSSQIVHGVTHLELSDNNITLDTVTYEQSVDHVEPRLINPIIYEEDASKFSFHKLIYRNRKDDLCIRVQPCTNVVEKYNLYISFTESPTILDYNIKTQVSKTTKWINCINASTMKGHTGMTYLGVETKLKVASSNTGQSGEATDYPCFELSLVTAACLNWEEDTETWRNDQCKLEWKPDRDKVKCVCNEIKDLTFGASFVFAPNAIDFSTAFLKFSPLNQAAVIATLCILLFLYIVLVVWARRHDRRDICLWGIQPLVDNYPSDRYFFLIKVYTGLRLRAGTESKIGFRLSGDRNDTGVRLLSDGIRKKFEKGSVMQFLMSTHLSLGVLTHLRIWHDNKGMGELASWYLSKIVVTDLQDNFSYTFLCEDWISVETSDNSMDKLLFVADQEYLESFNHRFTVRTKDRLVDGHLWASILYRPTFSNFTRVQRATCAYMALMITMLANAMYFNPEANYETPTSLEIGPFRFSLHQVIVALICATICTVPTLLVITIFKRSRRRITLFSDMSPQLHDQLTLDTGVVINDKTKRWFPSICLCRSSQQPELVEREYIFLTGSHDSRFQLPFWCSYLGWFLAIGAVVSSAFIILLYSMEWGKQKSEEWLSTFLLSMVQSVIAIDPFLVVSVAFCIALMCKSVKNDDNSKKYASLNKRNTLTANEDCSEPPLRQTALEEAKKKRTTEIRKRTTAIELISNFFWLLLLFSISYSNRDDRAYGLHETVINMMNRNSSEMFNTVNTTAGFFRWLDHTAIPVIHPTKHFNGDALHWTDQQFLHDLSNFKLGPPRLRQLRVNSEPCNLPWIDTDLCYREYSYWSKETGDFCLSWHYPPCAKEETVYNHSSEAWKYSDADVFSGIPLFGYMSSYENGGYKADLDINRNISDLIINEMYESTWIDRRTRAVILEFTVYCVNINVFAFSMFMVEFPETGGALPSYSISPIRVFHHIGPVGTYILICEVLALFYILFIFIRIGLGIFEHKCQFIKHFWLLYDIGTAVVSVHAIVFYAIRLYMATVAISRFQEDKRLFVDFYQVAFYDKLFVVFLGLLVFLSTVRCLRILEGNKHVYIVAKIFYKLANDLLWLGILLVFVFVIFALLGSLLFGTKILSYMNLYKSLTTLFLTVIGKSKFTEINELDPILAKIYFTFFVFVVSLLMLSVFLSSLSACIQEISLGQSNVDDVFLMAIERLLTLLRGKPEPIATCTKQLPDSDSYTTYSMTDTDTVSDLTIEDLEETDVTDTQSDSKY